MDTHTIAELADRLIAAEESRTPIEVPSIAYPGMTVADGYAVQRPIIARKVARGDIVADCCGNAGIISGGELHSLHDFDLRCTGMVVAKNGESLATGATGAVMGNPAQAVAWLTNKLAETELTFEEGAMVLSGSLAGAMQMVASDLLTATFGGGLGAVGVKFV